MWIWQFDSATLLQPKGGIESYKTYVELQGKTDQFRVLSKQVSLHWYSVQQKNLTDMCISRENRYR